MGSRDPSARMLLVDVGGVDPEIETVDVLARLALEARRGGFELRLRGSSPELRDLVAFAGLEQVLPEALDLEPRR